MSETKTAKQLEDAAYDEHWSFSQGVGETEDREGYFFTPEQLQAYKSQLCREQREICAKSLDWADVALHGQIFAETTIKNAPEPE